MLFDDEFIMGGRSFGGLDDAFGLTDMSGFGRFGDDGEIVITGRVPGALYVDDISIGQTLIEHIQPVVSAQAMLTIEIPTYSEPTELPEMVDDTPVSEPPTDDQGDAPSDAMPLTIEKTSVVTFAPVHRDDEPTVALVGAGGDEPLIVPDHQPLDLFPGRPQGDVIDLPPAADEADTAQPDSVPPQVIGGRAYQQLSFLILDTPYVYGDDFLPVTVRPPLDQLFTPAFEGRFVLPQVGAWVLGPR